MNNNLDVKPEIIFKDLSSVLSKSITINVDLKKRNTSLYLHEYISIYFGNTQRTEPAFHDLFEEHVKDQLNHAHKRYRDHFNSDEFQEIIYNWGWFDDMDFMIFGRGHEGGASNAPIFYGLSAIAGAVLLASINKE